MQRSTENKRSISGCLVSQTMKYLYRTYRQDDLVTLQHLMLELGYSIEPSELRSNISEIYKKGGQIFISEKEGKAVASICVLMDARLAEGIYAEIVSLIVSEKERGKGIGKELVKKAEDWASRRVTKIRVRANEIRQSAHAFYKYQGYEEVKTQKVFTKSV